VVRFQPFSTAPGNRADGWRQFGISVDVILRCFAPEDAQIEIRGQVLDICHVTFRSQIVWLWNRKIVPLRPVKPLSTALDILTLTVPGCIAKPVTLPPDAKPDAQDTGVAFHFLHEALNQLAADVWAMIGPGKVSKMAECGLSAGFPYRFKAHGKVFRL
jgi:hypothetical protein